ncbi:hypothetical protein ANCCAN_06294, partial [Ancylostoma caninum]
MWIGLFAAVVASVLFGSVFVPIKRVAAGDGQNSISSGSDDIMGTLHFPGFTAQLFMCIGAFMAAAVVHGLLYFPPFYGFAMISGALWCTANAFAIQIMNRLGMALSVLVWNTMSCLTGWATSRYGLFGLPAAIPASTVLNYLGIVGLIAGGSMYLFVKNDKSGTADIGEIDGKHSQGHSTDGCSEKNKEIPVIERALSFLSAMLSGLFYGTMWLPISYIR